MSVFVEAARLLASLAAMGQQFSGPTGSQVDFGSGEYLAGSVTSICADGLGPFATIGGKIAVNKSADTLRSRAFVTHIGAQQDVEGAKKAAYRDKSRAVATSLIAWTLTVVEVLELTTGFGPPCEGDELTQGAQQFAALSGQLMVALPEDNWQGAASQSYAEADSTLGTVAQRMAELDGQLGALIHDQADWVTHIRLGFGILKVRLVAAYGIELAMKLASPSGPAQARVFAITVCGLGLTVAAGMLVMLDYYSHENAQQADDVAGQYGQLAQDPVSGGARVQSKVATAEESSVVSSFEGDSARMAMTSATSEASAAASVSDGSAAQRAALGGVRDAGEAAVVGAAAAAPAVSMPTLAEVSAWSGRAATLSGHASQHLNLVNQTMGSVQQITSMSQQSQPAPAPAEETPTDEAPAEEAAPEQTTGEVDGATAAVGSETAERVPLEAVAVNIHQTPQPDPIGRSG